MFPDVNSKPIYCNAQHPRMTIAKMEKVQRACKKYSSFFLTEKFEKTDKNLKTSKRLCKATDTVLTTGKWSR